MRSATLLLAFSATLSATAAAHAEVRMKFPFLSGATVTQGMPPHSNNEVASDIDFSGHPTIYAPITGTLVKAVDDQPDNTLTGSELQAKYGSPCTPTAWGYGNYVLIQAYDGTLVRIAHNRRSSLKVQLNSKVTAGQAIAEGGSSGHVCAEAGIGDHAHVEYKNPQGVLKMPGDLLCTPLLFPNDDPGQCDVGNNPSSGPTCSDGIKNGTETGVDCGGSCPPCGSCADGVQNGTETGVDCGGSCPPCVSDCSDGQKERCWVECSQNYMPGWPTCVTTPPLLPGVRTCIGGQWGSCVTNDSCTNFGPNPCSGGPKDTTFECLDGSAISSYIQCVQPFPPANCSSTFYSGSPISWGCEYVCAGPGDTCPTAGEKRTCEVHCDTPNGPVKQGQQECIAAGCAVGNVWNQCVTNQACSN